MAFNVSVVINIKVLDTVYKCTFNYKYLMFVDYCVTIQAFKVGWGYKRGRCARMSTFYMISLYR